MSGFLRAGVALLFLNLCPVALAGEAVVAAAANFSSALDRLAPAFERETGHRLKLSLGSTGKLYAQIINGAPFDVFLSADQERAAKVVEAGLAAKGARFTYAVGRLVLWVPAGAAKPDALRAGDIRKVAVAHPELAPYGKAAMEALKKLGLQAAVRSKLVIGENIGQAFAFVASGNAQAGFVAEAHLKGRDTPAAKVWEVPPQLHAPILQDAVLLRRGEANDAAIAFFDFLRSEDAKAIIRSSGYALD